MRDETSTDNLADEGGKIGRNGMHALLQVLKEVFTVLAQLDHSMHHASLLHALVCEQVHTHQIHRV